MAFNVTKTKYMVVSQRNRTVYPAPSLSHTPLEKVSSYTQLGLTFDETLSWENHINQLVLKANKKIDMIWRMSNHLTRLCVENIYNYYIRPVLDYGSIIYDNCNKQLKDKLEDIQRRTGIACTRAFCRMPTKSLLHELGWPTLDNRRKYLRLLQLYKMKHQITPN